MRFKRFVGAFVAMAMLMSMTVFSVSVSAFSASELVEGTNYAADYTGDVKGNPNAGSKRGLDRTMGGNDAGRNWVQFKRNSSGDYAGADPYELVYVYSGTSSLVTGAKYVHSSFRISSARSFDIRVRRSGGNKTQWMNFYADGSDGYVNGNGGTAVNFGGRWNVAGNNATSYNYVDMIFNTQTGTAYCFVNEKLVSYTTNLMTDGIWYGYSIYAEYTDDLDWAQNDILRWAYNDHNGGASNKQWTWYKDSEDHTVTIEEVMARHGLAPDSDDDHFIFSNDDVADYMTAANSATLTYPQKDSMVVEGNYYSASTGDAKGFAYMFSGTGYQNETVMGGSLLYLSYTQQVNNASRVEVRLRVGDQNQNSNRFTFTPDGEKFHANGFSGSGKTLDKAWGATVKIGILIDKANHKAYSFVDGKQLGGAFDFSENGSSGQEGIFNDVRIYLNGTEDSAIGTVTLTDWKIEQYDSGKDLDALFADITGKYVELVYYNFRDASNGLLTELAGATRIKADVEFRVSKSVTKGLDAYLAVYSGDGMLKKLEKATKTLSEHNNTMTVTLDTDPLEETDSCKMFFWEQNGLLPLAESVTYVSSEEDPIKVLALGNSFSKDSTSTIKEIAAADNVSMVTYNAYLAGKTLSGHYNAWNDGTEYRIEKEGVSTGEYQTLQEFVTMDDWDYIILQGATHFDCYDPGLWNVNPSNTQTYWTTLKNGIKNLAPSAKRLVHGTWAPINELAGRVNSNMFADGSPDSRGAYLKALQPNLQIGANIYSTELATNGKNAYIPTAVAIDYLVRHYNFPEYIGDLDNSADDEYDNSSTTRAIYRDKTCHLTYNVGRVLAGLVWYEMITGNSAVDNRYERATLSSEDMAKLKEAAHYACQNYMTYDPETVFSEDEAVAISATPMKVKNGAKAIVSFIHDDGSDKTFPFLPRQLVKNNLNGTIGLIGNRLTSSTYDKWNSRLEMANGRLNIASHSYSHEYLGETDNGESGTLSDGTEFTYEAGRMTAEIANERARINSYFPNERVLTFIKPGTKYPSGKPQVSTAAKNMIKEHYIAMRNTGGGVDTIPPADYYSVKSYMGREDTDTVTDWIGYLEEAYEKEGMIVYLFHNMVTEIGYYTETLQTSVAQLFTEIGNYVADNRVWSAKFDEAIQYCREYESITKVEALNVPTQNKIVVEVRDSVSKIDYDITSGKYAGRDMYDYPITVKTQIPYNWTYVKMTQSYDDRMEIVKTFVEDDVRYAYVNVVPDQGAATLTEATSSDYVSTIKVGGTAISGFDPAKFYYKVNLSSGTTTAPTVTTTKAAATVTNATLDDGEGSAFVEFNGLKYEIHFSVQ